jgi:hypothetical protein
MMIPPAVSSKILATGGAGKLSIGESREINKDSKESQPGSVIELMGDAGIRTLSKPGRVTLIIQESDQSNGDHLAMLNIMVTDIFSLSLENFYDSINVPIGSSSEKTIPINYMNEHAHLFAKNLEGIELDIELSHP